MRIHLELSVNENTTYQYLWDNDKNSPKREFSSHRCLHWKLEKISSKQLNDVTWSSDKKKTQKTKRHVSRQKEIFEISEKVSEMGKNTAYPWKSFFYGKVNEIVKASEKPQQQLGEKLELKMKTDITMKSILMCFHWNQDRAWSLK